VFIESWRASRGSRQGRLHCFMCNASGPARSPDAASGCRALRKSASQWRLCRDSTRQRVASRQRQENRAVVHTKLGNSQPGVAVLGDPGRVGEKDLQVGLHGLGEHGVHGRGEAGWFAVVAHTRDIACAESTHRAGAGPHRIGSSPRGLIEKPSRVRSARGHSRTTASAQGANTNTRACPAAQAWCGCSIGKLDGEGFVGS
jgi:hypothetical protein